MKTNFTLVLNEPIKNNTTAKELISYLLSNYGNTFYNNTNKTINELSLRDLTVRLPKYNTNFIIEAAKLINDNQIIFTISNEIEENRINVEYIINDNTILVKNDSTCFCNHKLVYVDIKDLLKKYKGIISLCKSKGIKIKYNYHIKKNIDVIKREYITAYEEYKNIFNSCKSLWLEAIKAGIYNGYSYTLSYEKISELDIQLQKLNYNIEGNIYAKAIYCNSLVNEIYNNLLDKEEYYSISL